MQFSGNTVTNSQVETIFFDKKIKQYKKKQKKQYHHFFSLGMDNLDQEKQVH